VGAGNFSLWYHVHTDSGPSSLLSNGYHRLFPWGQSGWGVKLTTHSIWCRVQRMCGDIPPLPQYILMAWCLVKHRGNFTFYLYLYCLLCWTATLILNFADE